jgi:hypothetical protein
LVFDQWPDQLPGRLPLSDQPYRIDIPSIRRAFPPGLEAPPLLLDFATWLVGRPWGSVGCFDLRGQFSDTAPVFDSSPLRDRFALFMRLPDGSAVGAWYAEGFDSGDPPIVGLGSEGDYGILAPSLAWLIVKLAAQEFGSAWHDLAPHEDVECKTVELAQWLATRLAAEGLAPLEQASTGLPDFRTFIETWSREREEYWANHPMMAELGWRLAAHLPKGKNPRDKTHFEVAIAGAQFQARVFRRGPQAFEEAGSIESLLRELREEMRRDEPELGLWYTMSFGLYADGRVMPRFDYDARPMIGDAPADISEAKRDLARAPRPDRWVPTWLAGA